MCSIFRDIAHNWIDFLSMSATVATMLAAFYALSSWKSQRQHELKVEVFSISRRAVDLVRFLRDHLSFGGEITEEVMSEWVKYNQRELNPIERHALIFQSRLQVHKKTYEEILYLRERIWAEFPDDHIFLRFFDLIVTTIIELSSAHRNRVELIDKITYTSEEFAAERARLAQMVISRTGDEINVKVDKMFQELLSERKR